MTPAPTIAFSTLGCRLNQVDTRQLQAQLEDRGFRTVPFGTRADVVVVNTCTVTARAELSDRQAIRRARRDQSRRPGRGDRLLGADESRRRGGSRRRRPRRGQRRQAATARPGRDAAGPARRAARRRVEVGDIAAARLESGGRAGPHRGPLARLRQDPGRLPAPVRLLHRAVRARRQPQSAARGDRGAGATARGGRPSGDRAHRRGPRPLGRRPHAALEPGRAAASASSRCPGCAGCGCPPCCPRTFRRRCSRS